MTSNKRSKMIYISWGLLLIYTGFMIYVLFISSYYNRVARSPSYNLIPFKTIGMYMRNLRAFGLEIWATNLLGNIIVFMPVGILPSVISKGYRSIFKILLLTMLLSLTVELLQLVLRVGSFDIDDIILNTIGGGLGYIVYCLSGAIYPRLKD